ncbi:LPS translocon maturation chaperone LptM [Alteromonas sp. CYL-A6]|uniref:LPS translocon maturation chaperone LptM n=1 Tax=Alteromonas nitratireducens TaxID=3390813 RepID=UPI0034B66661
MFNRRILLIVLTLLTTACGYRGALYLPEEAPDNQATSSGADPVPSTPANEQQ